MVPTRTTPSGTVRPRRLPQRTCVACRRGGDQRTFVRLVRAADGTVAVDERGRAAGRGAYLCRAVACWERGAKGALSGALRTNIDAANRAVLLAYGAQFAPDSGDADNTAQSPLHERRSAEESESP